MIWPFNKKSEPVVIPPLAEDAEPKNPKGFTHGKSDIAVALDAETRFARAMERSFNKTINSISKLQPIDLATGTKVAMDADMKVAFDNNIQQVKGLIAQNQGFLPVHILEWYSSQGFIGWQICAILAQNWLVNKACKMPGQDAVRHGFERTVNKDIVISPDSFDKLRVLDKRYKLKNNLIEHYKFARVFGLRHTLFLVDGIDYELPFNIDGVKEGSYKGMVQIDPYWLAPMFSMEDASDPSSQNFYNPTWWMINGRKYHRSHFVISRNGNDLADILKPTYFYGGISTVQMIYERVYAAERTANEAPLLAMTKRLLTLTTDTTKAMSNLDAFRAKLTEWMALINNFGLKILGKDEKVEQIDTSLAEFNETIRTQFSLVASASEVPESKLMGNSPKGGLGSEGTYDADSYHEFLESVQELELSPIVERHTQLCQRSEQIEPTVNMDIRWNSTDSPTAKEIAEINKIKADTDVALTTAGSIDGLDGRKRLISDKDSNYNGIEEKVEGFTLNPDGDPIGGGDNDSDGSAMDADWKESDHPRKDNGEFGQGSGPVHAKEKTKRDTDSEKLTERVKLGDDVYFDPQKSARENLQEIPDDVFKDHEIDMLNEFDNYTSGMKNHVDEILKENGYEICNVDESRQSQSQYWYVRKIDDEDEENGSIKIRFSDHGDHHGGSDLRTFWGEDPNSVAKQIIELAKKKIK